MRHLASIVAFAIVAIASACGCSTQAPVPSCVPGQSAACVGNAGCAGSQVCAPGGTYAACECGTPVADGGASLPDGAIPDGATPDGAIPDGATPDGALPPQDAGTDADAGPFSPDQLDLSLWLDAEKGIVPDVTYPSRIKRWFDQSGHGNNAEIAACSGDPLLCMPRIDPKVIAGHDAVEQASATFTIADSPSMRWGTGDWAVVLVGKLPSVSGNSLFWSRDGSGASGGLSIRFANDFFELWVGPSRNATLAIPNPNTFQIVVARGQKNEIRIGGSTATGPQTVADLDTCVGCTTRLISRPRMGVAELIAVKGGLTDLQVAQVTAYYKAKYNLP